jgi:hypothetical protein
MKAEQLLNDIARTLGLPELALNDEGCARLLFDGQVAVNFENDPLAEKLHLYADLGELPLRGREALYRALLEANLLGAQTAGGFGSAEASGEPLPGEPASATDWPPNPAHFMQV